MWNKRIEKKYWHRCSFACARVAELVAAVVVVDDTVDADRDQSRWRIETRRNTDPWN